MSAACLYLESFGNGHKFSRLARRFARTKPLLAVVGGRSEGGRRAGASHTAAAASPAVAMDALLDHSGVVTCHGADDMVTTALLLEQQPLPAGDRVGIVTNAGGMGVLAADRAAGAGLRVPHLSESVGDELVSALSASAGWSNPVDTGAGAGIDQLVEAVRVVTTSDEVDCALVVLVATTMLDTGAVVAALAEMRRAHPGVPAALVVLGDDRPASLGVEGFTVMPDLEHAVLALGRAARRAAWLESPREDPGAVDLVRQGRSRSWLHELCPAPADGRWLSFGETAHLLHDYGLDLVGQTAVGSAAACEVARATGFPVALKVAAAGVHKSDLGLVAVGLDDEQSVTQVVDGWGRQGGAPVEVLVQPMARGVEVAVGLVRDPAVGGLVMIAAGGVDIDVWDDRVFLLAPVSAHEVEAALRSLKVWTLLRGHRGAPAASVESLVEVVQAVSRMADELPDVAELDLNPVVVSPTGAFLVDARLRVEPARASLDAPALSRPRQA